MESIGDVLGQYQRKRELDQQARRAAETSSGGAEPAAGQHQPTCVTCGDIGWVRRDVPVGDPDFGEIFPCTCALARFESERRQRLTKLSNLGALGGVTFDALDPIGIDASAVDQARGYAAAPSGWIVLLGPTGSGKTHLAAAIANERIEAGQPVFFVTAADLLDHLRSTYAPGSDLAYDEMFEQVRGVPLLVLDDLGGESATPWAREKLAQVLTHRYNERLPTVITTPGPVRKLDERIAGRLVDSAIARIVRLGSRAASGDAVDVLDTAIADLTFENFDPTGGGLRGPIRETLEGAFRSAHRFAQHPQGSLTLVGGPGSGKTHLMAAIAGYQRQQHTDVLYVLIPKLFYYLRSTFGQSSRSEFESIDRLGRVDLLMLDDLDVESSSEWAWNTLDLILNQRTIARLPTVIAVTTYAKIKDLGTGSPISDQIPRRIWSRLSDMRQSTGIFEIRAPDYRTGQAYTDKLPAASQRRRPSNPPGS